MSKKKLVDLAFVVLCIGVAYHLELFGSYIRVFLFFLCCMAIYVLAGWMVSRCFRTRSK